MTPSAEDVAALKKLLNYLSSCDQRGWDAVLDAEKIKAVQSLAAALAAERARLAEAERLLADVAGECSVAESDTDERLHYVEPQIDRGLVDDIRAFLKEGRP